MRKRRHFIRLFPLLLMLVISASATAMTAYADQPYPNAVELLNPRYDCIADCFAIK
ncbi:MAG: hypothetical protein ACOX6P_08395 [Candidatus Merdivicinus sp.]|jgi:hypothetical protein